MGLIGFFMNKEGKYLYWIGWNKHSIYFAVWVAVSITWLSRDILIFLSKISSYCTILPCQYDYLFFPTIAFLSFFVIDLFYSISILKVKEKRKLVKRDIQLVIIAGSVLSCWWILFLVKVTLSIITLSVIIFMIGSISLFVKYRSIITNLQKNGITETKNIVSNKIN